MKIGFKKVDDREWLMVQGIRYTLDMAMGERVKMQLANDYNITSEIVEAYPDDADFTDYKIIVKFDNDADEAEFLLKTSDGVHVSFSGFMKPWLHGFLAPPKHC